jgi:hypothetical protein
MKKHLEEKSAEVTKRIAKNLDKEDLEFLIIALDSGMDAYIRAMLIDVLVDRYPETSKQYNIEGVGV